MTDWLSSIDAVVIFTGSEMLHCNEAAVRLFSYPNQQQLLSQTPAALLLSQQPDSLSATERLLMLIIEAQQEGVSKGAVAARSADGKGFFARLVILSETGNEGEAKRYYTKWLRMRSSETNLTVQKNSSL
ncbi:hypothetical protein D770_01645 [Flammeovirgaceae bacterium 311]|nr:hypothetical protein D770_01645 [Flammeovirgaceae bacterium 311]